MALVRVVRLTVAPNHTDKFLEAFDEAAPLIRDYPGCEHLELWEDISYANRLTTYSIWSSADALNTYRETPLFEDTWATLRNYFAGPPAAESFRVIRRHQQA